MIYKEIVYKSEYDKFNVLVTRSSIKPSNEIKSDKEFFNAHIWIHDNIIKKNVTDYKFFKQDEHIDEDTLKEIFCNKEYKEDLNSDDIKTFCESVVDIADTHKELEEEKEFFYDGGKSFEECNSVKIEELKELEESFKKSIKKSRPSQGLIDMMNGGWEDSINEHTNHEPVYTKKYSKEEVVKFMEAARDRGERDGDILWEEWLTEFFNKK